MQRLEVSGAVRPIYGSLGVKRLSNFWSKMDSTISYEVSLNPKSSKPFISFCNSQIS